MTQYINWQENNGVYDKDWKGILSLNWALNVHDADVHNTPINELFHRHTWINTTLAAPITKWDYVITVNDTNILNWFDIQIEDWIVETTFPKVLSWWWTTTLTLDRPIDNDFIIWNPVEQVTYNMNVDWSTTPVAFRLIPDKDQTWHIVRFLLWMVHDSAADDSKFGSLDALTRWCVLRWYNWTLNQYRTFTNWKSNEDIKMDMFDLVYTDKSWGWKYWTNWRWSVKIWTWATPTINWANWDYLELLIQDDLTDTNLTSFNLKWQWHIESM